MAASRDPRRREGLRDVSMPTKLQQHGREAYEHAQALGSSVEQAVDEIGSFVRDNLEQRPYVTLATAAGVGYVLGGGIPTRLTALLFGLGSRFAIEMFLRELVSGAPAGDETAGDHRDTQPATMQGVPS